MSKFTQKVFEAKRSKMLCSTHLFMPPFLLLISIIYIIFQLNYVRKFSLPNSLIWYYDDKNIKYRRKHGKQSVNSNIPYVCFASMSKYELSNKARKVVCKSINMFGTFREKLKILNECFNSIILMGKTRSFSQIFYLWKLQKLVIAIVTDIYFA